jgi:hypothetical protein
MIRYSFMLTAAVAALPAAAAEMTLRVDLPRMTVAEYHRPYVATWIEKAGDQSFAGNVAVWYDVRKRDNGGAKWLKEMRQWWRKSGRELQAIPDGVSGATRPAGEQRIDLLGAKAVTGLAAGSYEMVVEAARENGGREVLRVPFEWPIRQAANPQAKGEGELAGVALEVKP